MEEISITPSDDDPHHNGGNTDGDIGDYHCIGESYHIHVNLACDSDNPGIPGGHNLTVVPDICFYDDDSNGRGRGPPGSVSFMYVLNSQTTFVFGFVVFCFLLDPCTCFQTEG